MLMYANRLAQGKPFDFAQEDMTRLRARIAGDILDGAIRATM